MDMRNGMMNGIKKLYGEVSMRKKTTKNTQSSGWMARTSLVLILTMLFSMFMHQGWYRPQRSEATGTTNGRAVFGNNSTTPQQSGYTASTNTFAAGAATVTGAIPTFMVNKSSPSATENIAGYVTTGGVLYIMRYSGGSWTNEWNATVGGNGVNGRRFDIAYEASGRAMVVYSRNAMGSTGNEMGYRIWTPGAPGSWSAEAYINSANLTRSVANNAVAWIKLAARRGTNQIGLAAVDNGNAVLNTATLTSFVWNGSAWGNEPATALETTYSCSATITTAIQYDNFDIAYESLSGDLIVVWSYQHTTTLANKYANFDGSAWGTGNLPGATQRAAQQTYAVANPRTDQILAIVVRSGTAGIYGYIWNGGAWDAQTSLGITMTATATVNKHWATGQWLNVAGTEYAVAIAQTSTVGTIGYNYFTGSAWGTAATLTGVGATNALSWVDSDDDQNVPDTLIFTGSYLNTTNILLARRLVLTAGPTFTWTAPTGSPMGSALTNVTTQNFDFEYEQMDITPPTTSGVTIDSPVYNTFVGSPFTFHGDLADLDSAVSACTVCVKNGAECISTDAWVAGTLSGSGPWTCTATNVTTYSNGGAIASGNVVYVDVRGTSTGGTNTNGGTAVFKTMDKTGPTDGTLSLTPGVDQNALSWTAATDAQSGVAYYDVRSLPGTTVPADCNSGASVYSGTGLSYTHIVTPYAGGYSYRVCAVDNVAMKSAGQTRTGLPLWSSTISSCTRCHASPVPGGARNNPEGAVVGSHESHTTTCSVCHVVPGGTEYGHRDSNINMLTGAAGLSGGYYDKNNNAVYEATDATFAQTNTGTPPTASCRNISCHGGNNPTPQWGIGTVGCTDCHNAVINSPVAQSLDATVTTRRNVVQEFKNTWSHKRSTAGGVPANTVITKEDCIVCHMEGNMSTGKTNPAYHANGYIDLRNPDTGNPIEDATWTNSPAGAGSYSSSGTALNSNATASNRLVRFSRDLGSNILEIQARSIQVNQCLKCHDADGAASTSAQVPGGSAFQPFGVAITGHAAPYNSNGNSNVVNVAASFATSNSTYHPISGKQNNSYTQGTLMVAPWNMTKTTGNTTSWGYLMTCWDCHAPAGTSGVQTTTVTAHGGAATLRSPAYAGGTTAPANICLVCHATTYASTSGNHAAGSAFTGGSTNMNTTTMPRCTYCHAYTAAAGGTAAYNLASRPLRGENAHGFNDRDPNTVGSKWVNGVNSHRPYAFIRNTLSYWSPTSVSTAGETLQRSRGCTGTGGTCDNNMTATTTYSTGGVY